MSKRDPNILLSDIIEAVEKIKRYTDGLSYELFNEDSKTQDAVIRNFEIIGEAANQLPQEFRLQHRVVNWYRIIGFRNRIVHDYMGVDYQIVWTIIQNDLDNLSAEITDILQNK